MSEAEELIQQAAEVAHQATRFDSSGSEQAAAYYYEQAASLLDRAASLGAASPSINDKINQYRARAATLHQTIGEQFIYLIILT